MIGHHLTAMDAIGEQFVASRNHPAVVQLFDGIVAELAHVDCQLCVVQHQIPRRLRHQKAHNGQEHAGLIGCQRTVTYVQGYTTIEGGAKKSMGSPLHLGRFEHSKTEELHSLICQTPLHLEQRRIWRARRARPAHPRCVVLGTANYLTAFYLSIHALRRTGRIEGELGKARRAHACMQLHRTVCDTLVRGLHVVVCKTEELEIGGVEAFCRSG